MRRLFYMQRFSFFYWVKVCSSCFRQVLFSFEGAKKWSLVALDKWSPYTGTIAWKLAWMDATLVVLDEWSSYRVSHLRWFSSDTAHSGVHIYDFCGKASPHFYGNEQGF